MPRMARLERPGSLYHIMAHSIENRDLFVDDEDRKEFLFRFEKKLKECNFQCYAWALMDNHYHLMIRANHFPLCKLMRGLNSGYARYYNKKYKRRGYLFQDRFKSVICQDQQYAVELIKYIHLNPLRARKIESLKLLENWIWCGHGFMMGKPDALGHGFQTRQSCLRYFGENEKDAKRKYYELLEQSCNCDDIKNAGLLQDVQATEIEGASKGWPAVIGDPDFAQTAIENYKFFIKRKHRRLDYKYILEKISKKICNKYFITPDELKRRGRKNIISDARASFCYQAHIQEFIPLSVIAEYLKVTISPVAVLVKKGISICE